MKIALTMLCSLLLLWAQVAVAAAPATSPVARDCGCGGKMACCQSVPSPASQPLPVTVPSVSQNQIVSPVPATVVDVLSAALPASISPVVAPSLNADAVPLLARLCVRLL